MNVADDKFNISKIESYLYGELYGTLTQQTYVGTLPETIKDTWQEMCLIDCGSSIVDEDARASGTVMILLYARPNTDGSKNVPKNEPVGAASERNHQKRQQPALPNLKKSDLHRLRYQKKLALQHRRAEHHGFLTRNFIINIKIFTLWQLQYLN